MLPGLKILIAAGCCVAAAPALPVLLNDAQPPQAATLPAQQPAQEQPGEVDPFAAGYRARFSQLQITDAAGQVHSIPARSLLHVRLLKTVDATPLVEIFYQNGDYSLMAVHALHVIQRSQSPSEDVLLSRAQVSGMRFPAVQ